MSRWFRHYAGMMRDDKLVRAAVKSKQPVERVVWVWGAILESASEINDGGRYELDEAEVAYFLRSDEADIRGIVAALEDGARLADGRVVRWGDRQYASDRSAERQRRYRDNKKTHSDSGGDARPPAVHRDSDAAVTSPSQNSDAPEADTETETEAAQQVVSEFEPPDDGGVPSFLRRDVDQPQADRITAELRDAAGDRAPNDLDISPILALTTAGYDLVRDVLPVIRERAAKAQKPIGSWRYFVKAIEEARGANGAIRPKANGTPSEPMVWLPADSPRWGEMNRRSIAEKKRPLFAQGSTNANGVGTFVPQAWLDNPQVAIGSVN